MSGKYANSVGPSVTDRWCWVTRWVSFYPSVNVSGEHEWCCIVVNSKGSSTWQSIWDRRAFQTRRI